MSETYSHYSELAAYYHNCETEARSGVLCRGEGCKGWFLSEVDTWHHCRACNPQATNHPENDYDTEEEMSPEEREENLRFQENLAQQTEAANLKALEEQSQDGFIPF